MVKTVKIKNNTHARLLKHGDMGDTFDAVLNKLMDIVERKKR